MPTKSSKKHLMKNEKQKAGDAKTIEDEPQMFKSGIWDQLLEKWLTDI